MSSPSPQSESTQRPVLSQLVESIFSPAGDDNNVMMAAIVSLVVVILFVFLLHLYARTSFHSRSLRRRRRRSIRTPPTSSSFVIDLAALSGAASKGLDPAAIAAIPLFVSGGDAAAAADAECVVCLTEFDDGEVCRRLPKCGHEFHVECVDMWLGSHASCPICRAPAAIPDGGSASASDADSAAIADRRDPRAAADGDGVVLAIEIIDDGDDNSTADNSSGGNGCSSSSPTTSFGCSLKRMLSRNRSEHKASPAEGVVNAESTE